MYVRKPLKSGSKWVVIISESISPISRVLERATFNSHDSAYQFYRETMKELGRGL